MLNFIVWLRRYAIFEFLWWIFKNLWPFICILLFWKEIDGFFSQYQWWWDIRYMLWDIWYRFQDWPLYTWMQIAYHTAIIPMFSSMKGVVSETISDIRGYLPF